MRSVSSSHSPRSASTARQFELLADEPVEPLRLEGRRNEVQVRDVVIRDHGAGIEVGEEGDLLADLG